MLHEPCKNARELRSALSCGFTSPSVTVCSLSCPRITDFHFVGLNQKKRVLGMKFL